MKKRIHNVVTAPEFIVKFYRRKLVLNGFVLFGLLCAAPGFSRAQQAVTMSKTDVAKLPFSPGLQLGDTLYLSGHLGVDPAGGKVPADPEDEA